MPVPQIVEADAGEILLIDEASEGPGEQVGRPRPAILSGEDETLVFVSVPESVA
jgi:hypothetical protein